MCDLCNGEYKTLSSLHDHKRGAHGLGSHYTASCGKVFKWRMSYHRHKKQCGVCSQKALSAEAKLSVSQITEQNLQI